MSPLPEPSPASPPPTAITRPLDELLGESIEIEAVETVEGVPVILVAGKWYSCDGDWASRGATYLEAELASRGGKIKVRVAEENDQVGFRE